MTIRRRLTISFLAILLLFGLNVAVYSWSNHQRGNAFEGLRRAMSRQILVMSIDQDLTNSQKQVSLQSQISIDAPQTGVGSNEKSNFNRQLENISRQIIELETLSDSTNIHKVARFRSVFGELRTSWQIFYENFGVDHEKAITELALRGSPLGRILMQQLRGLENAEKQLAELEGTQFYKVTKVTNRITMGIFIISIFVAIIVAYLVSHHLVQGLDALKQGAGRIGEGNLEHHISIETKDELGELAQAFNGMTDQLRAAHRQVTQVNKELEAFSYSVSHDLRAPLRRIDGFSQALLEDYEDNLDENGKDFLHRVRSSTQNMADLVDDLLTLSRVSRGALHRHPVQLSEMAKTIAMELRQPQPKRTVEFIIAEGIVADGDERLLRSLLTNLFANAWKYTEKQQKARIEFGTMMDEGKPIYFIRDNGAGFSMDYRDKLFAPFQRLHSADEFEGTGIGLATVQRIVYRHKGTIWAQSSVGKGATFYFTL